MALLRDFWTAQIVLLICVQFFYMGLLQGFKPYKDHVRTRMMLYICVFRLLMLFLHTAFVSENVTVQQANDVGVLIIVCNYMVCLLFIGIKLRSIWVKIRTWWHLRKMAKNAKMMITGEGPGGPELPLQITSSSSPQQSGTHSIAEAMAAVTGTPAK